MIVGSNTIRTVYDLNFPILVVPAKAEFIPVKKIGFACDYRQVGETTPVTLLKKIVTDFHAELHVMNVDHHNKHTDPAKVQENFLMNDLLRDTKAEFHSIEGVELTEGINWFVDRSKLDWLVVIPKNTRCSSKFSGEAILKNLCTTHIYPSYAFMSNRSNAKLLKMMI